jgi:hypothetical protein
MVAQDGGPYGRTLVAQSAGEENFRFTPIRPAGRSDGSLPGVRICVRERDYEVIPTQSISFSAIGHVLASNVRPCAAPDPAQCWPPDDDKEFRESVSCRRVSCKRSKTKHPPVRRSSIAPRVAFRVELNLSATWAPPSENNPAGLLRDA